MRVCENGIYRDMTSEELARMEQARIDGEITAASRPLTDSEILRIDMRTRINSLGVDHQTAGRMIDCFPTRAEYCSEGELIPAGTRIRDDKDAAVIWRANVDLWNTTESSPENAPALWDKIAYHDGIRVIPDVITSTLAWMNGELGWRDGVIYRSEMDGNAHLPGTVGAAWVMLREDGAANEPTE